MPPASDDRHPARGVPSVLKQNFQTGKRHLMIDRLNPVPIISDGFDSIGKVMRSAGSSSSGLVAAREILP
jgi:hypothetical protein